MIRTLLLQAAVGCDCCQRAVVIEAEVRTAPGSSLPITSLVCIEQKQLFSSSH